MSIQQTRDIQALRKQLFDSLERLGSKVIDPNEIERAKAIAETAQTIINSAKVEVEFLKVTGGQGSGFIPLAPPGEGEPPAGLSVVQKPGVRITRHRLA